MKNMKKTLCLLLAVLMTVSLLAGCGKKVDDNADSKKVFTVGIDAEYPPFSYLGDDGSYTGFDIEIAQAACDQLGWEMKVFPVNWEQKLTQLDAKECDCIWSGMTILDSMKEAGYTLSAPYYDNTQVIMVKEGSDIKSSADLAGKVVAVQLGTSGDTLLSEDGDLESLTATFKSLVRSDSFLKCFTELSLLLPPMPIRTPASPSSPRNWAPSNTASPSAPMTRSCAPPSRAPSRPWWITAPMPRSLRSILTSSITSCS